MTSRATLAGRRRGSTGPADAGRWLEALRERLEVWEALESCPPHAAIVDVFDPVAGKPPTISLRTVYDVVHLYERLGLVRLCTCREGRGWRRSSRPTSTATARLAEASATSPGAGPRPGRSHPRGFVIRSTEVVVTGLCPACAGRR